MSVINFKTDTRIDDSDREVLREFCQELGGDPVVLAYRLGLKVYEHGLHESIDGYIAHDPACGSRSGYKVVLNSKKPLARKKFTLAHELGHYVLHRESEEFAAKRSDGAEILDFPSGHRSLDDWDYLGFSRKFEREADTFAATILLPPAPLRRSAEFQSGEPAAMARRLELSTGFVARRFEEVKFGEF